MPLLNFTSMFKSDFWCKCMWPIMHTLLSSIHMWSVFPVVAYIAAISTPVMDPNTDQSISLSASPAERCDSLLWAAWLKALSSLPPHVPLFLPLSWAVLSLPFDLLPIWIFSPKGQLWDCIQHFYIATVCWLTLWGMQKWQTGGNGRGPICNFPLKWHVALFPHSYSTYS